MLLSLIRKKEMNLTSFMGVKMISGFAMEAKKMVGYATDARVVKQTLDAILIRLHTCVLLMDATMICVSCA